MSRLFTMRPTLVARLKEGAIEEREKFFIGYFTISNLTFLKRSVGIKDTKEIEDLFKEYGLDLHSLVSKGASRRIN